MVRLKKTSRPLTPEQQIDAALKLLKPPADGIEQCRTDVLKWLDRITAIRRLKTDLAGAVYAKFLKEPPPRPQLPSYVAALGAHELVFCWAAHEPKTTFGGEWHKLAAILFGDRDANLHRQLLKVRPRYAGFKKYPLSRT
jgi:hypothetical protein